MLGVINEWRAELICELPGMDPHPCPSPKRERVHVVRLPSRTALHPAPTVSTLVIDGRFSAIFDQLSPSSGLA
jgi:hypothetical protein